jgi:hypothetical protein
MPPIPEGLSVSRLDSSVLPAAAREHAWSALWQRLLRPVPDDSPASEPYEHPDDELAAEDEESAA